MQQFYYTYDNRIEIKIFMRFSNYGEKYFCSYGSNIAHLRTQVVFLYQIYQLSRIIEDHLYLVFLEFLCLKVIKLSQIGFQDKNQKCHKRKQKKTAFIVYAFFIFIVFLFLFIFYNQKNDQLIFLHVFTPFHGNYINLVQFCLVILFLFIYLFISFLIFFFIVY